MSLRTRDTRLTIGVTGASGFIGSFLLSRLASTGAFRLRALTRTISRQVDAEPPVEWVQGDLASLRECMAFADGLDVIVHLAHTNTPLTSNRDLPSDAAANALPTATLVQAIRELQARPHVIYASSGGAVYGRTAEGRVVPETTPCQPGTSYGIQKLLGEHYLRFAAEREWLTATALRMGNAYGVPLRSDRLQGFIGVAISRLLADEPVRIFGDPGNVRDYVHLDDVGQMFELVLEPREAFTVYNVGTGIGHSVLEVLAALERATGRTATIKHIEPTEDAALLPSWVVLDSSKARHQLGWTPLIDFEDGIRAMCDSAAATTR